MNAQRQIVMLSEQIRRAERRAHLLRPAASVVAIPAAVVVGLIVFMPDILIWFWAPVLETLLICLVPIAACAALLWGYDLYCR